jgi:hypothetical protein
VSVVAIALALDAERAGGALLAREGIHRQSLSTSMAKKADIHTHHTAFSATLMAMDDLNLPYPHDVVSLFIGTLLPEWHEYMCGSIRRMEASMPPPTLISYVVPAIFRWMGISRPATGTRAATPNRSAYAVVGEDWDGAGAGTSSWSGRPRGLASAPDNPRRTRSNGWPTSSAAAPGSAPAGTRAPAAAPAAHNPPTTPTCGSLSRSGPNGGPAGSHLNICFSCGANSDECAGAARTWRHCPQLLVDLRDAECIEAYHNNALPYIPKRLKEKFDSELHIAAMVLTRAADAAGSGDAGGDHPLARWSGDDAAFCVHGVIVDEAALEAGGDAGAPVVRTT